MEENRPEDLRTTIISDVINASADRQDRFFSFINALINVTAFIRLKGDKHRSRIIMKI